MKIELKLREVRNSLQALTVISGKEGMPFKLNYKIAKICQALEPCVKAYETALRKFIKENGEVNPETGQHEIKPKTPGISTFSEMNESLLDEDLSFDIEQIQCGELDEQDIPANLIRPLLWLIKGA